MNRAALPAAPPGALGLYVHVPFCTTRCRYCDFYRVGMRADRMEEFLAALHREIDGWEELHGRPVDSVFLGGGTPSLLTPGQIAGLLDHLESRFRFTPTVEITAECNPSDLDRERLAGFRAAAVNRLSLGVQSFGDRELHLIGRRHDAAGAALAVELARQAGFDNLSLDLILALPGQTRSSWQESLRRARALAPEHLSVYLLEINAGQEVDRLRRQRPRLFPSEAEQARRYRELVDELAAEGWRRYEISNFALPGRESVHNLRYWQCRPYLGLGPAAHSLIDGRRFCHPRDLAAYLRDPRGVEGLETAAAEERLFLGLRLTEGIPAAEIGAWRGLPVEGVMARAKRLAPYVEVEGSRIRLSVDGALLSTSVIAELLYA